MRHKPQGKNEPVQLPVYRPSGIDMVDELFSEENMDQGEYDGQYR